LLVLARLGRRRTSRLLFVFPDTLDLRPKLADHIAQNTEPHLGESALAAGRKQVMVRSPSAGNHSGAKGRGVKRNLRPDVGFRAVVGDKVPGDRMTGARPEVVTAAAVVSRFIAEDSVTESAERAIEFGAFSDFGDSSRSGGRGCMTC